MNSAIQHAFTSTLGVEDGEIVKYFSYTFPPEKKGIKSQNQFILKYKNSEVESRIQHWKEFLDNISEAGKKVYVGNTDPIVLLAFLYYSEGLPIKDVFLRVEQLLQSQLPEYQIPKIVRDNFNDFLKKMLEWELRDCNERTEYISRKRRANKNMSGTQEFLISQKKQIESKYKNLVACIIYGNYKESTSEYDQNTYHGKEGNIRKMIYLLSIKLGISEEKTLTFIRSLNKNGIGNRSAARMIQNDIDGFNTNLRVTENNIYYINKTESFTISPYNRKGSSPVDRILNPNRLALGNQKTHTEK
ncbi:hypothetical protein MK079_03760, partial [Candidatus Gracilibacteria bacterium]|nr:hypothetical protein [Candidatus Gracilibacteria bacterium]